ncbi:MAG: ABC transporter ATP-binding protein [Muribaculaceae bacterium]|nr:ABC transporter ATP-binding protein [Muribaculaceae bacterium]
MLLTFRNVYYSYDKNLDVLKGIDFSIGTGEKVALLGLNGAGKSTLMLLTNGLLIPTKGEVLVNGLSTNSKNIGEIRKTVGLVFQNPDDQLFMHTVKDDVAFGPRNMNLSENEVEERVEKALRLTGTGHLASWHPFDLSGGQKKSVSIATVLSMEPELIVMDEPTSGLDYMATQNFVEIVESLSNSIILSTHDMDLARRLCTRAIVLKSGEFIYDGDIASVPYPL